MFCRSARVFPAASRRLPTSLSTTHRRYLATGAPVSFGKTHKIVVVGGGSAGLAISHQLLRSGKFASGDIAIVDPATWHHYQPGWTLVGGGLKAKDSLRTPLKDMVNDKFSFYNQGVATFSPENNAVALVNGDKVSYDHLIVAPGIKIDYASIKGLPEALADQDAPVSTIYGYDSCDKTFRMVEKLKKGDALFTQPTGIIKCAGAPQKVMWLALDHWKRAGLYDAANVSSSPIKITFATGAPTMFGVPKYSAKLEELRRKRAVEGLFQHDLVEIDGDVATFITCSAGGEAEVVKRRFDLLHAVPKMGPHPFVSESILADGSGYVDVHPDTLQHKKFANVWSAGDAANLPTSKTMAAIASQAPVLVSNVIKSMEGKDLESVYDGYTSCPLLTEYGKVLLAEFKYGGEPKETFNRLFGIDQATPRRAFYHLKKDFFPWVYSNFMVKGTWAGARGWLR
ncbi:hypothetical protein jhhlp_004911 [Lomentospora prolificans]|uniref:FAD/NAD(P)-binding domain-containing protein n=1 Tax=Lomentospora prolificans TaxID=41688 RepID=A0A2N3N7V5_9PEZI|nr:hypothetical protein jhhlp_004911 [Lomentospora prolificans]